MTLKEFREFTKDLPEDSGICYHAYYKGCCLSTFELKRAWIFDKDGYPAVVINPGTDYDGRWSKLTEEKEENDTCQTQKLTPP